RDLGRRCSCALLVRPACRPPYPWWPHGAGPSTARGHRSGRYGRSMGSPVGPNSCGPVPFWAGSGPLFSLDDGCCADGIEIPRGGVGVSSGWVPGANDGGGSWCALFGTTSHLGSGPTFIGTAVVSGFGAPGSRRGTTGSRQVTRTFFCSGFSTF